MCRTMFFSVLTTLRGTYTYIMMSWHVWAGLECVMLSSLYSSTGEKCMKIQIFICHSAITIIYLVGFCLPLLYPSVFFLPLSPFSSLMVHNRLAKPHPFHLHPIEVCFEKNGITLAQNEVEHVKETYIIMVVMRHFAENFYHLYKINFFLGS